MLAQYLYEEGNNKDSRTCLARAVRLEVLADLTVVCKQFTATQGGLKKNYSDNARTFYAAFR